MDFINLECDEDFDVRCGEIYLTVKGCMQFHCTLCEKKYDLFQEFYCHIEQKHRPPKEAQQNSRLNGCDAFMVILDDDSSSSVESMEVIQDLEEYITEVIDQCISPTFDIKNKPNRGMESAHSKDLSFQTVRHDLENENEINENTNSILDEFPNSEIRPEKLNLKRKKEIEYKCPHCKYSGKDKANFNAHVKRHFSINKNKKCTQCPMTFHSSCELKRHLSTHTGEKPFLCQECGIAYSNKHKLKAHFKRHLNLRDVPCSLCDKTFFSKQALEEHMAVHTDDRRYSCNRCQAKFKLKKGLRTHNKIHENQLQYKCSLCPARFNQNPGLRSHLKSKHDIS